MFDHHGLRVLLVYVVQGVDPSKSILERTLGRAFAGFTGIRSFSVATDLHKSTNILAAGGRTAGATL